MTDYPIDVLSLRYSLDPVNPVIVWFLPSQSIKLSIVVISVDHVAFVSLTLFLLRDELFYLFRMLKIHRLQQMSKSLTESYQSALCIPLLLKMQQHLKNAVEFSVVRGGIRTRPTLVTSPANTTLSWLFLFLDIPCLEI